MKVTEQFAKNEEEKSRTAPSGTNKLASLETTLVLNSDIPSWLTG